MNVQVYYQVCMSYAHKEPESRSIGTCGLGPCLGILARSHGQVFCGHMSCGLTGIAEHRARIMESARTLMVIQNLAPIDELYFAAGAPDTSTRWMAEAISRLFFPDNTPLGINRAFGIFWKGGDVGFLPLVNDTVQGTVRSPRDPSQPDEPDGPFNVT